MKHFIFSQYETHCKQNLLVYNSIKKSVVRLKVHLNLKSSKVDKVTFINSFFIHLNNERI
jgi:hypothetical protein